MKSQTWIECGQGILLHPNEELSERTIKTEVVELKGFGRIFEVFHYGNEPEQAQRLILAAPELLAALEQAANALLWIAQASHDRTRLIRRCSTWMEQFPANVKDGAAGLQLTARAVAATPATWTPDLQADTRSDAWNTPLQRHGHAKPQFRRRSWQAVRAGDFHWTINAMNLQNIARLQKFIADSKPRKLIEGYKLKEPLQHGWMLTYLLPLETFTWGRWDHWAETKQAGRLLDTPIPQIHWSAESRNNAARKMLEKTLGETTGHHDWHGWGSWSTFDYFLDWLLFGFGDPSQKEEPQKTGNVSEGASERLYQTFNLEPLLAYPHDYFGDILAENSFGRSSGFFPTPMEICSLMVQMQMTGEDMRAKSVCDPALGTGRMLLAASNYSFRLYGNDINNTVIKACRVNGYLYAPWLVRSFDFLDTFTSIEAEAEIVPHLKLTTHTEKPQLEMELV